jgi:hypothetical protein
VLFVLIFQFEFYLLLSMHVEILVTCINFKLFFSFTVLAGAYETRQ